MFDTLYANYTGKDALSKMDELFGGTEIRDEFQEVVKEVKVNKVPDLNLQLHYDVVKDSNGTSSKQLHSVKTSLDNEVIFELVSSSEQEGQGNV